jgi:hypothetical protein
MIQNQAVFVKFYSLVEMIISQQFYALLILLHVQFVNAGFNTDVNSVKFVT